MDRIREAIADLVEEGAEEVAVVFDDELTPDQQKNLEKRLQVASRDELQPRNKKVDKKKKALEKQARVFELRQESPYLSQAAARAKINQEDRKLRRRGESPCCRCPSVGSDRCRVRISSLNELQLGQDVYK